MVALVEIVALELMKSWKLTILRRRPAPAVMVELFLVLVLLLLLGLFIVVHTYVLFV